MVKILLIKKSIIVFVLFLGLFVFLNNSADSADSDAIAIRVFPNPEHFSALSWYKQQNFEGSPQSIQVDGYEAVLDGHSVYVNVANLSGSPLNTLYTNIYLITYNQNADNDTEDIFANILDNWKFNSNLIGSGSCIEDGLKNCQYDSECSIGDYCNSIKARLIRDTKRLSDLAGMNIALENYYSKKSSYPGLSAGTYLPGKTLSVWPSWSSTLSSEIGIGTPIDPINKIGLCGSVAYNKDTCWNDVLKTFATTLPIIPPNSLIYGYYSYGGGTSYGLCANFETPYIISPPLPSFVTCVPACLDFDGDGYGIIGSSCPPQTPLGYDCDDTPFPGIGPSVHPGATEICGDGIDQDCNGSDLACVATCVNVDGDGYDNCNIGVPGDDGLPIDCDDGDSSIHPGAADICDGIDNNCASGIDESCDIDNDNFCSCSQVFSFGATPLSTCTQTDRTNASTILATCDCSDSTGQGGINPGATEICDGVDNNCALGIDETCDLDGDNYCECSGPAIIIGSDLTAACINTNTSNPFWIAQTCDCVDASTNSLWNPGITEPNCFDGLDGDCDGLVDALDPDCAGAICGNSIIEAPETCDDGNNISGDGCSATCIIETGAICGNSIIEAPETCDDGNIIGGDGCSSFCGLEGVPSTCGNNLIEGVETCDDGNILSGDGCSAFCGIEALIPSCGNNLIEGIEQCDDGNNISGDGCSATCIIETGAICGNSIIEAPETCDDGNNISGDGCSATCIIEAFSCTFPFTFPCTF